ncbi:hypothetical protein EYC80_008233 [Monilinia laxa]|uniref:Uncharacterized protein n=1 Tax=Monilinia laxa TaxID=61186 RepID=A0A5N6JTX2_MONLA|nr:hypothetical protein EYC80_008233 [Monilinia laxa]
MHIIHTVFSIILLALTPSITSTIITRDCVGSGKYCTLYMKWHHGSSGLAVGIMDPPADLTVFSTSCAALTSKLEQPTKNGQIIISAQSLPYNITVTGADETGRPLFLYNATKQGHENCGQGTYKDGVGFSCTFPC